MSSSKITPSPTSSTFNKDEVFGAAPPKRTNLAAWQNFAAKDRAEFEAALPGYVKSREARKAERSEEEAKAKAKAEQEARKVVSTETVKKVNGPFLDTYEITRFSDGHVTEVCTDVTPVESVQSGNAEDVATVEMPAYDVKPGEPGYLMPHQRGVVVRENGQSRYFKAGVKEQQVSEPDAMNQKLAAAVATTVTPDTPDTPPPPELALHPVFDGDASAPVVNIPMRPLVRLPPKTPTTETSFESQLNAAIGQPTDGTSIVIANIRALFHKSDAHKGVSAFTKPVFDVAVEDASVSGPNGQFITPCVTVTPSFAIDMSSSVLTKPIADDDLFEPPAFGSTPTVRVPTQPHRNHQFGYSHESQMGFTARPQSRLQRPVETQTISLDVNAHFPAERGEKYGIKLTIKLPGFVASEAKTVNMPHKSPNVSSYRKHSGFRRNITPKGHGNAGAYNPRSNKQPQKAGGPSPSPKPRSNWYNSAKQTGGRNSN